MKQNVPKQQIYYEVPFYMFVIVIAAFLFVWRQFYEITLNALENDGEIKIQKEVHSSLSSGIQQPLLEDS